ncbi:MAG: beta-galactosidase [Clostridia bacterium]|nr:beta-galactosidase [Clostridia bacterium]
MKKLLSFLLILALFTTILPAIALAEETVFEVYEVSYADGACTVSGRCFRDSGCTVSLTATGQGKTTTVDGTTNSDGSFALSFKAGFVVYQLTLSAAGEDITLVADLSGLEELFALSGNYTIVEAVYTQDALLLTGTQTGTNTAVAVTLKNKETGTYFAVDQLLADESGNFAMKFKVAEGDYTFNLKAEGLNRVSCNFAENGIYDSLTLGEENYPEFLKKLALYAENLETLRAECQAKGITTDYEDVNLEIIKKFAEYSKNEAAHDDFSRMGQYNYALTRLYDEASKSMKQYLNGSKAPFGTSRYVTGDIRLDGTSVIGTTETNGILEEKPVFFVGYGPWDTVVKEIPFFSKIGLNMIQTELSMRNVFVPYWIPNWSVVERDVSNVTMRVTQEDKASGNSSLKLNKSDGFTSNIYKYMAQEIAVKPNTTYTYGLKAKGTEIETSPYSVWFNIKGTAMDGRMGISPSASWKEYGYTYTTGRNENTLKFTVLVENKTGNLYLDDMYVREQGTDINLLKNGGFETTPDTVSAIDKEAEEAGWAINHDSLNWLKDVLETAEEHNVLVDINVCPHYMPKFILNQSATATAAKTQFLPFAIDDEVVRKASGMYARLLASIASKYDSVHSICITNEPSVEASNADSKAYYATHWQNYLKDLYGTIEKLNQAYGSSYTDFSQISMPTGVESTPVFYDYRSFNDNLLVVFHEWFAKEVKKANQDIKVHAKVMDYLRYNYQSFLIDGTDYERMADVMDLNGCDAFSYYYGQSKTPMTLKMGWYDLMTSLADKPVWDTESHIMDDFNIPRYDNLTADYTAADIWNGAIHGRGASVLWLWDTQDTSMPWGGTNYPNANAALRPEDAAAVAKTALDLNRLSDEVTALQKTEAKIGLLYSRTTLGYNEDYMTYVGDAYEEIIFSGQKVGFVTDSRPEDMHKYDLLVIPGVTNVKKSMLDELGAYLANGGKILLTNSTKWSWSSLKNENIALKYDEYNKAHSSETVTDIIENSIVNGDVSDTIASMGFSKIILVDTATGKAAEGIEWSYAKYGDKYLVNIINYSVTKNVKLQMNGKDVTGVKELRTGTVSDVFAAKPYQPILIEIEPLRLQLVDANGTILESNISSIKNGKIRCESLIGGDVVLALYKDDSLVKASITTGELDVAITESGSYRLMATVWDMKTLTPITDSRNLTMEVE